MKTYAVPGLSVAVVQDGKVVLAKGYGVSDLFGRTPVTPQTEFQVASTGKVVTAYMAARLVDAHRLDLDKPLSVYLSKPWATSAQGQLITLRQALSHTSGLSNSLWPEDRKSHSDPGHRFSYSGVGFVYVQRVIEAVSGGGIDAIARRDVFGPLGMSSSAFEGRSALSGPLTWGHVSAGMFESLFVMPTAVLWILLSAIGLVGVRLVKKRWTMAPQVLVASGVLATLATTALFSQSLAPTYLLTMLPLWGVILGSGALLIWLMHTLAGAMGARGSLARRGAEAVAILALVAAVVATAGVTIPVAAARPAQGNVAFSLCTTASDMARLVAEINNPKVLSPDMARQMLTPQARLSPQLAWGLGVGLYGNPTQSYSQWGSNPGFEALVVGIPGSNRGVVLLSNRSGSLPMLLKIAHDVLGGSEPWSIRPPTPKALY